MHLIGREKNELATPARPAIRPIIRQGSLYGVYGIDTAAILAACGTAQAL